MKVPNAMAVGAEPKVRAELVTEVGETRCSVVDDLMRCPRGAVPKGVARHDQDSWCPRPASAADNVTGRHKIVGTEVIGSRRLVSKNAKPLISE